MRTLFGLLTRCLIVAGLVSWLLCAFPRSSVAQPARDQVRDVLETLDKIIEHTDKNGDYVREGRDRETKDGKDAKDKTSSGQGSGARAVPGPLENAGLHITAAAARMQQAETLSPEEICKSYGKATKTVFQSVCEAATIVGDPASLEVRDKLLEIMKNTGKKGSKREHFEIYGEVAGAEGRSYLHDLSDIYGAVIVGAARYIETGRGKGDVKGGTERARESVRDAVKSLGEGLKAVIEFSKTPEIKREYDQRRTTRYQLHDSTGFKSKPKW